MKEKLSKIRDFLIEKEETTEHRYVMEAVIDPGSYREINEIVELEKKSGDTFAALDIVVHKVVYCDHDVVL